MLEIANLHGAIINLQSDSYCFVCEYKCGRDRDTHTHTDAGKFIRRVRGCGLKAHTIQIYSIIRSERRALKMERL